MQTQTVEDERMFQTTKSGDKMNTLQECVGRMQPDQDYIYYISGKDITAMHFICSSIFSIDSIS